MKRNMKRLCVMIAVFVFFGITVTNASQGIGARAMGMGGAHTAIVDDETAIYWNPSMLIHTKKNFSISIPQISLSFISNLDRDEIDDLDGDEIETIGDLQLELGIGGMVGFHQSRLGIAGIMDVDGMVNVDGENLDKIEDAVDIVSTYNSGGYATSGTYINALTAAGLSQGATVSTTINSEFEATVGGAVSYAMKFRGLDVGATLKILQGQLYQIHASYAEGIPYATDAQDITYNPSCTDCFLIDADGTGYSIDLAMSKDVGEMGPFRDARMALMVRDFLGSVSVSGYKRDYEFVDKDSTAGYDWQLEEVAGSDQSYSTTIDLAPEIVLGFSGRTLAGIATAIDFSIDTDNSAFGANAGIEKKMGIFALRGGLQHSSVVEEMGWTVGFGLDLQFLSLDLAYGDFFDGDEGGNLAAGLSLEF